MEAPSRTAYVKAPSAKSSLAIASTIFNFRFRPHGPERLARSSIAERRTGLRRRLQRTGLRGIRPRGHRRALAEYRRLRTRIGIDRLFRRLRTGVFDALPGQRSTAAVDQHQCALHLDAGRIEGDVV